MLIIGLTGGIGSGKSSVAMVLKEKGAHLIDFDKLAHELEMPETAVWFRIVREFGDTILTDDGTIDRQKLGKIVFNDRSKLDKLNSIVHPAIIEKWEETTSAIHKMNNDAIVIGDVPLLFETKLQRLFDAIILVYCSQETQIQRVISRSGLSRDEVTKRLEAQLPIDKKIAMADFIIDNGGTPLGTKNHIDDVWEKLIKMQNVRRKVQ
ncbi:MAG: dephospho-CoA kinase [Deltaproteobacteria bacterium]